MSTCASAKGTIRVLRPFPVNRIVYGVVSIRTQSTVRSAISCTLALQAYINDNNAK